MTIYYIGYGYAYVEIIKVFNENGNELNMSIDLINKTFTGNGIFFM